MERRASRYGESARYRGVYLPPSTSTEECLGISPETEADLERVVLLGDLNNMRLGALGGETVSTRSRHGLGTKGAAPRRTLDDGTETGSSIVDQIWSTLARECFLGWWPTARLFNLGKPGPIALDESPGLHRPNGRRHPGTARGSRGKVLGPERRTKGTPRLSQDTCRTVRHGGSDGKPSEAGSGPLRTRSCSYSTKDRTLWEARELAFHDFADRVERMSDTERSKVIASMV